MRTGGLRLLDRLGLLDVLLPEVAAGKGVSQPEAYHAYDVFEHGIRAVEAMDVMLARLTDGTEARGHRRQLVGARGWRVSGMDAGGGRGAFAWCADELRAYLAEEMSEGRSRASLLKLAALLHDVAKPQTRTVEADGRVRFFGHADLGADDRAHASCAGCRFSASEVRFVSMLVARAPAAGAARAGRRGADAAGAVPILPRPRRRGARRAAAGARRRRGGARAVARPSKDGGGT